MPSASSVKPEKQASTEAAPSEASSTNSNQQNTPLRQAILIIGHKIRNLDKRKAKLETYRELQRVGKELHQDQKVAVAKYDEVMQTLEFARDLWKQFNNLCTISEKETKKTARKEASLRVQQDLTKIREVLLVQDTLAQMGIEKVREDFLLGRNGAATITPEDLQLLDEFYPTVTPKHSMDLTELECQNDLPDYNTQVHNAAEQLLNVVDAKQKEFSSSTFAHIKEIIDTIQNCGYLEKPSASNEEIEHPNVECEWKGAGEAENVPTAIQDKEFVSTINTTPTQECPVPEIDRIPDQMPPMPNFPPVPAEVVQSNVSVISSMIEHSQPQYYAPPAAVTPQQPRHISEILEAGNFYFLQDSELGEVDMLASAHQSIPASAPIPSQTFTNQNFTNVPNVVVPTIAGTPGAVYPTTNLPQPIPISSLHPSVNPNIHQPSQQSAVINASTFSPPKEFDSFNSNNQTKPDNSRNEQKNGNEWSEQNDGHRQFSSSVGGHSNRPRGNGGNKNNRSGGNGSGNSGYYQNNYYPNNGYGGYKPRAGTRPSGGGSGQRQNSGGGHKGSGQYSHRSKSSQQPQH